MFQLFSKKPHNKGDNQTYQYHGSDRNIDLALRPFNDDIPGEVSKGNLAKPGPQNTQADRYQTDNNEYSLQATIPKYSFSLAKLHIPLIRPR